MYENIKAVHQYYRDQLSSSFTFPAIGNFPLDVVVWAFTSGSTDSEKLKQLLTNCDSGLGVEKDLAIRQMLQAIIYANGALDRNISESDRKIPEELSCDVKKCIDQVFKLHPDPNYLINCMQLLYRINEIDMVMSLAEKNPQIVAQFPPLQAMLGFIHTAEGHYEKALPYLEPLFGDEKHRSLPFVGLSTMTCHYFLGQTPQWPMKFDSLDMDLSSLDKKNQILPEMEIIEPVKNPDNKPIVFAACNDAYFYQHLLHLAYSLNETNPKEVCFHIHLFSPNKSVLAEIKALQEKLPDIEIGVSVEESDLEKTDKPSTYYATIRYLRAYELLEYYDTEMFIVDADALFRKSWKEFSQNFDPETEIVMASDDKGIFWEKIAAGVIYFKPKEFAKNFLAKVAQFILYNYEQETIYWFLDQVALSACDDKLAKNTSKVKYLPTKAFMDISHGSDALVWVVTENKFGYKSYNEYRETLGKKYGLLPQATPEFLYEYIRGKEDILQIDSEKDGYKILEQFDFEKTHPAIINLKYFHLTKEEKEKLQDILFEQGYVFYFNELDILAIKRSILFSQK